jgi:pimeloyl-ACP methyl ester carboxylesterase
LHFLIIFLNKKWSSAPHHHNLNPLMVVVALGVMDYTTMVTKNHQGFPGIIGRFLILSFFLFVCTESNTGGKSATELDRPQDPQPPFPYDVHDVSFSNTEDGAHLSGTVTTPGGEKKVPAVVLISGSGLQDRDETAYGHKPFKVLADYLTRRKIAVLRYDDRGAGRSTGPLNGVTPVNFAKDAYAGWRYLQSRDDIAGESIGLIGHSMGAVEGGILASRYDDIAFLIMLGGPGIPLDINMLRSDSLQNIRSGKSQLEVKSGQNLLKWMIEEAKKDKQNDVKEIELNRIIQEWRTTLPDGIKADIEAFSEKKPGYWRSMASEWATPYFRYVLNYDPYPVLTEIECPVLSLIGEKDVQTPPLANSEAIRNALKKGKCPEWRVEVVEGVNHLFQRCDTGVIGEYEKIPETFDTAVLETIADWIHEQVN